MSVAVNKVLALINSANSHVSNFKPVTTANVTIVDTVVNTDSNVVRDTKTTIAAIGGTGLKGKQDFWYNRIHLDVLFKNINANVAITVTDGMTTDALIPLLNAKYGTDFEPADFVSQPLVVGDSIRSIDLSVVDGNAAYVGTFTVRYAAEEIALNAMLVVTTLDGFNYPSSDLTKGQASLYSYNLDGSANDAYWAGLNSATVIDGTMVDQFNQLDGLDDTWVFNATVPAAYNLSGASVVYNGDTAAAPANVHVNPAFNKVLIIQLSSTDTTNFGGLLTVNYGGKVVVEPTPETETPAA